MSNKTDAPIEFRHSAAAEEWATSEERTPLFSVVRTIPNPEREAWDAAEGHAEGEVAPEPTIETTVTYTMPSKPNAGLAMEYLRVARKSSADMAASWLIELAVGEDGYDALVEELAAPDVDGPEVITVSPCAGRRHPESGPAQVP